MNKLIRQHYGGSFDLLTLLSLWLFSSASCRNSVMISGILGKRTRFQQKDISQLVLQVTVTDADKSDLTTERGFEECTAVKVEQDLLPKVGQTFCQFIVTPCHVTSLYSVPTYVCLITFCVSRRRRKMCCGHARLSVCGHMPTLLHGPGCNIGWW